MHVHLKSVSCKHCYQNNGIPTFSHNGHLYPVSGDVEDGAKGLAAIPGAEDKFKASLETSIQYCKALNCKK